MKNIFFSFLFLVFFSQVQVLPEPLLKKKSTKQEIEKLVKESLKDLRVTENFAEKLKKQEQNFQKILEKQEKSFQEKLQKQEKSQESLKKELNSKFFFSLFLFLLTGTLTLVFLYFERKKLVYDLSSGIFRRARLYCEGKFKRQLEQEIESQVGAKINSQLEQKLREEVKIFLQRNTAENFLNPDNSLSRLENSIDKLALQIQSLGPNFSKEIQNLSPHFFFLKNGENNYNSDSSLQKPLSFVEKKAQLLTEKKKKNEEADEKTNTNETNSLKEIRELIKQASLEEASGQIEALEKSIKKPTDSFKFKAQILLLKALLEHKRKNYPQALEYLEQVLALDSSLTEAWNTKGILLDQLGEHENAIECYQKAIQLKSSFNSDQVAI